MAPDSFAVLDPADLLEILQGFPPLEPFRLTLCTPRAADSVSKSSRPCGSLGENSHCQIACSAARDKALQTSSRINRPAVFSCPAGLLGFAIPLELGSPASCYLLGGGIREKTPIESIEGPAVFDLEKLPEATRQDVETVAEETSSFLRTLFSKNLHTLTLEKFFRRSRAVAEISREVECAKNAEMIAVHLCETAIVMFNLPRAAVVFFDPSNRRYRLGGSFGLLPGSEQLLCDSMGELFRQKIGNTGFFRGKITAMDREGDDPPVLCRSLEGDGQLLGALALFTADLPESDLLLLDSLAGRGAARLLRLRREEEFQRESANSERLLEILNLLMNLETQEDLCREVVEMAADLLNASSGSLMLLDETGENLCIESAKKLQLPLARGLSMRIGAGIAGKVAKSGMPLLVTDIEKDSRVAIPNRPRFRTKSFISVPLKAKNRIIGVLNLADKESEGIFTEADLNRLTTFATHIGIMIERVRVLERASLLEELSITDPLTGLYNRRFLEHRLDEELSRSLRQNLSFTLILIDLDNFKLYNDLCGHVAGDTALKKLADLLKITAREMDLVIRYGGEEFCLILPGTSKKESIFVAERIRRSIEKESFPHESCLPNGRLTASLGIASFPEDGQAASALIHAADIALYQAKNNGRNRLVLYDAAAPDGKKTQSESTASN